MRHDHRKFALRRGAERVWTDRTRYWLRRRNTRLRRGRTVSAAEEGRVWRCDHRLAARRAAFEALAARPLSAAIKGIPPRAAPVALGAVGRQGGTCCGAICRVPGRCSAARRWSITGPLDARLHRGQQALHRPPWQDHHGAQLFRRQIEDGAWAITVATLQQLMVCRRFGFDRLLIANELIGPGELDAIFDELARTRSSKSIVWSTASPASNGSPRRAGAAATAGCSACCRDGPCRRPHGMPALGPGAGDRPRRPARGGLTLSGVEGFEGILKETAAVDAFLDSICTAAEAIAQDGLFAGQGPVILSAGGSAFYDRVAARFPPAGSGPRSGSSPAAAAT